MTRKLVSVAATILLSAAGLIGITSATTTAAHASVIPVHGTYSGVDHAGRDASLSFSNNQVSHIYIGHQYFGGAHVSNGMWHETCHNGFCTKGTWLTDKHIQGYWRQGGSHEWTAFAVSTNTISPYIGSYSGLDHNGVRVHFGYADGRVHDVTIGHDVLGSTHVSANSFSGCTHHYCIKAHWQTDTLVSGSWRTADSSTWHVFEANAYARSHRAL